MDTTTVLDKYTQDFLNLPLEVKHLFEELKNKDTQSAEARRKNKTKDSQIHKFIQANGTLTKHAKETQLCQRIDEDMRIVQKIQREKILLANTALFLVSKHLYNLETDILKLERDELLTPATGDIYDDGDLRGSETARSSPDPIRKNRTYSNLKQRQKRLKSEDFDDFYDSGHLSRTQSAGPAVRTPVASDDADNNLYCFCQRVSFGEMIGCDNDDCRFEWFHWSCVGITSPPKDDEVWYCPDCAPKMEKRKKRKKN